MLPPLRAVYTRILLRRMYYGHSGIRINTAFVSALLESNLLSLRFFLFFFRNFSGGFVNFAQRMFLTERNSGVPTFFWTFSEFSQKRNRLAFALYFFSPICRRFSIPIHAKRKFCVLKIPWRKKGFWQASAFLLLSVCYIFLFQNSWRIFIQSINFSCAIVLGFWVWLTDWLTEY